MCLKNVSIRNCLCAVKKASCVLNILDIYAQIIIKICALENIFCHNSAAKSTTDLRYLEPTSKHVCNILRFVVYVAAVL